MNRTLLALAAGALIATFGGAHHAYATQVTYHLSQAPFYETDTVGAGGSVLSDPEGGAFSGGSFTIDDASYAVTNVNFATTAGNLVTMAGTYTNGLYGVVAYYFGTPGSINDFIGTGLQPGDRILYLGLNGLVTEEVCDNCTSASDATERYAQALISTPEPGTLAVLLGGVALLGVARRRRESKRA